MKKIRKFLHHLMVPKKENNYRSKAIHHDFLTFYLIGAIALTVLFNHVKMNNGNVLGYATDISTQKLLELTNAEREKNGLPTLSSNPLLEKAAQDKAQDMFNYDYWSHYRPDGTATPWTFILGAGYQYEYAGENLAKNFLFSQGVVDAWMNSPSHRDNILRKDYTEVGFAVVNGMINGEETTLVVQMFGKPAAAQLNGAQAKKEIAPESTFDLSMNNAGEPVVLAKTVSQPLIQAVPLVYNAQLAFLMFLFFAFAVDLYIVTKLKIVRIHGKNVVHLLFLGFIIMAAFIIKNGTIF